ncbi:pentapeptide repeat-containing protein [Dactylosporangium sp. NPDC049140]|jgi:uncharacterized protein YjbI with pentapeptide repeats|uniref:pentapeptide repeat-containing protein n=1 Tax=Dactylosporangium sp. NPDC049140 TaxID=3155647 RepID=UPI0033E22A73
MPTARTVGGLSIIGLGLAAAALTWYGGGGPDPAHGPRCTTPSAADLSGRTVTAFDLDRPLRCANLHRATLQDAAITSADLYGADLSRATARSAQLSQVKLTRADLGGAVLRDSSLTDVGLQNATLRDADLRAVSFLRTDLAAADLRGADLTGATFEASNLRGARLAGARLGGTSWVNSVCPDGTKSTDGTCEGHLGA